MEQIKESFISKDDNGQDINLVVIYPGHRIIQDANLQYNYKISLLIRQAAKGEERLLMRSEIEDYLLKMGIWTKEDALKMEQLGTRVRACELMLRKGGLKKSEGRQIAIEMGELRNEMLRLYKKRQQLDSATVESVAENHRFNFLASKCICVESGSEQYFNNLDDYIDRSSGSVAIQGAGILAKMLYGLDNNARSNLFEIQWLKKAGFIDDAGRYVNKKGELTDKDGRRVNEDSRYINENGQLIDKSGNLVDVRGDFFVNEPKPFIDDETGELIELE